MPDPRFQPVIDLLAEWGLDAHRIYEDGWDYATYRSFPDDERRPWPEGFPTQEMQRRQWAARYPHKGLALTTETAVAHLRSLGYTVTPPTPTAIGTRPEEILGDNGEILGTFDPTQKF